MKIYKIIFLSKNKKSLENVFQFFSKYLSLNSNVIKNYSQKKIKRKVLTILKSPHVNKTAQEQFENFIFSKYIVFYSPKEFKYLFFLKKIQESLFSDVKLKIKIFILKNSNSKYINFNQYNINNNDYISQLNNKKKKIKTLKYFFIKKNKKIKYFLQILDTYGEFVI